MQLHCAHLLLIPHSTYQTPCDHLPSCNKPNYVEIKATSSWVFKQKSWRRRSYVWNSLDSRGTTWRSSGFSGASTMAKFLFFFNNAINDTILCFVDIMSRIPSIVSITTCIYQVSLLTKNSLAPSQLMAFSLFLTF